MYPPGVPMNGQPMMTPGMPLPPGQLALPQQSMPGQPAPSMPAPSMPAPLMPSATGGLAPSTISAGVGSGQLAAGQQTAAGANMIGDFFSSGITANLPTIGITGDDYYAPLDPHTNGPQTGTNLSSAGGDRRMKLAENVSPFPTDRVFFNYNHFSNPITAGNGNDVDVDRFTFGFEKTVLQGNASVELRIPFASGLSATQYASPDPIKGTEFGNLQLNLKGLLVADPCGNRAVSAGLAMVFPTAADAEYFDSNTPDNPTNLRYLYENDAFHLMPYLAVNRRFAGGGWMTVISQLDFATNGNDVLYLNNSGGVIESDVFHEQNFYYSSIQFGRYLFNACDSCSRIRNVAGLLELHYNTTLTNADDSVVFSNGDSFSNTINKFYTLNLTTALQFDLANNMRATVFAVAPLSDKDNVSFDAEIGFFINRFF